MDVCMQDRSSTWALMPTVRGGVNNVSSQIPRDLAAPFKTTISSTLTPHPAIVHRAGRAKAFISDALDFLR